MKAAQELLQERQPEVDSDRIPGGTAGNIDMMAPASAALQQSTGGTPRRVRMTANTA